MIIKKNKKTPDLTEEKPVILEQPEQQVDEESVDIDKIDLFNLDNIDFKQRQERRRGDRRRGFRRIDDRNLISRAREEAHSIKEAAAKEGYEAGIAQAQSDITELRNSIISFVSAKQEVFEYIAPDILEISVDIAKKIIKKEITQDPSLIMENIIEILKGLSKEEAKITIRVNPAQVDFIKQKVPAAMQNIGLEAKLLVIPDEMIFEGGCTINTTNGIIDATIDTQLSIISEALKEI